MTTEPRSRRTPQTPARGPARAGDHRATATAALLLAASAAAVTWLLLGGHGHSLRTDGPTASPTAVGHTAVRDGATRTGGDCAARGPRHRGCAGTGPAYPRPPTCCRPPHRDSHPAVRAARR
ncbi:hypothetical protein [Streptomyces sp. NPDC018045]|uniref:hypothetical protein n=1 Tax=Streptomyces sp. NPDC018045 TaxID=3365037 RepID=UPI0037BBF159